MKLGTKLYLGFSGLVALALLLGGMAVWKMASVKRDATTMAVDYMPAVLAANDVERDSLETMYEMRGYAFTEQTNFLTKGLANLAEVKKGLEAAKTLAAKSGITLNFLKVAAEKAEAKALEYEQLANQTVAVTEALHKDHAAMDKAAQDYMKECADYLASQNQNLQTALSVTNLAGVAATNQESKGIDVAVIQDRVKKINLGNDVVDLGNAIRIGNFKAQAERDPVHFQETQKKFVQVNQKLDELKAITIQDVNLKQIADCRAAGQAYNDAMTSFLKNWLAREDLGRKRGVAADSVLAEAKTTATSSADTTGKMASSAAGALSIASTTMIVGLCIALVAGILMAFFITRSITKPIKTVADALSAGADQTSSAASQVSAASQSLAEGASEQAASLEETSSSLEEMSSMTKRNAESAKQAKDLANTTKSAAEAGSQCVQSMSQSMDRIQGSSNELMQAMGAVKESNNEVAKIIKTIDEIAFQTNILALNAAVEAARAGEAGMGFAVVADEVRNLAQKSAAAARETAQKIEAAISRTEAGVRVSEKVVDDLKAVLEQSRQVESSLKGIEEKSREVNGLVGEIAAASLEQSQGIEQVNTAVSQMDKVTQSNAANAEESASAAEELNAQAENLKEAVNELLTMVDGDKRIQHATRPIPLAHRSTKHRTTAPHSQPALIKGKGGAKQNHNGAQHGAETAPQSAVKDRGSIPMENDFKDF